MPAAWEYIHFWKNMDSHGMKTNGVTAIIPREVTLFKSCCRLAHSFLRS